MRWIRCNDTTFSIAVSARRTKVNSPTINSTGRTAPPAGPGGWSAGPGTRKRPARWRPCSDRSRRAVGLPNGGAARRLQREMLSRQRGDGCLLTRLLVHAQPPAGAWSGAAKRPPSSGAEPAAVPWSRSSAIKAYGRAADWRLRGLHLDPGSGRMVPRTRVGRSALRTAAPAGQGALAPALGVDPRPERGAFETVVRSLLAEAHGLLAERRR